MARETNYPLKATLSADLEGFTAAMQRAAKTVEKTGAKMTRLGKDLAVGLSAPLAALGAIAIKASSEVDNALDKIRVGVGGNTGALDSLEKSFSRVFTSLPVSADQAAQALTLLYQRTGQTGESLEALSTQALNFSRITGQDLGTTVENVTRLFGDFSVESKNQAAAFNQVFKTAQATGVALTGLTENMVKFGAPMRAAGFSLEQTAALLAKWQKEGVNTELVAGSMRIALNKLSKAGFTDLPKALQQAIREIKGFKTEGEAAARAADLFGSKAGIDMKAAIREGRFEIDELVKAIGASPETINGAAASTDGFAEKLILLRNKIVEATKPIEGALTKLAEDFEPTANSIASAVQSISQAFADASPQMQKLVIGIAALLAAIGPLLVILGPIASGFAVLLKGVPLLAGAFMLLLNPITWVVAALGVMYAMVQSDDFDRGIQVIHDRWVGFTQNFAAGVDVIKAKVNELVANFDRGLGVIADRVEGFKNNFTRGVEVITATMQNMVAQIQDALTNKLEAAFSGVNALVEKTKAAFADLYNAVVGNSYIPDMVDGVGQHMDRLKGEMVQPAAEAAAQTGSIFDALGKKHKKHAAEMTKAQKEVAKAQKKHVEEAKKLAKEIEEINTEIDFVSATSSDPNYLSPLASTIERFLSNKNLDALKNFARGFVTNADKAKEFSAALKDAEYSMKSMARDGSEIFGSFGAAFGSIGSAFGIDGSLFSNLFDSIGKTDFGKDLLGGIGDLFGIEDISESFGELGSVVAGIGDSLSQIIGGIVGGDISPGGIAQGLSGIAGTIAGAILGGPTGAMIGSQIGSLFGALIAKPIDDIFNKTPHPETGARKAVSEWLEAQLIAAAQGRGKVLELQGQSGTPFTNVVVGDTAMFNDPAWADNFKAMGDEVFTVFNGLGNALAQLSGTTEDVGEQIGYILAQNLAGNIDNARMLVQVLGLDLQTMEDALIQLGESGKLSWHEVEVGLQGVAEASGQGLHAVGSFDRAFQNLIESGGRGYDAIKALKDIAVEAKEAGITSFDELRARLQATGQFSAEQINALFTALAQRGINSFDQLVDASSRVAGGVVADMESLGVQFAEIESNIQAASAALNEIPATTSKNIEFNITTNMDENTKAAIDAGMVPEKVDVSAGVPQSQQFAKGGVVKGATAFKLGAGLGVMGERGAEAIMPLTRVNGKLGVAAVGGGGGGTTINIDARGAAPGVEMEIRRALAEVQAAAERNALDALASSASRGGAFADIWGD